MRWLRDPFAIALAGLAFRALLIPAVLHWLGTPSDHFLRNEPGHIAAHLVHGDGFASPFTDLPVPTAQQPPLYPSFMAGIFELFGTFSRISLYVILLANCVAGALTAFFIYQAGLKYFSSQVALLSAWIWSIFAPIALTDITLGSYAFATLAVALWLNFVPDFVPTTRNWILLGVAVASMVLLNPMLVLLIPASALWLNKKQAAVMVVTAALCLAPWYVRNYRVMGHFYLALRDNLGMELYYGNHPGMSGVSDYQTGKSPYGADFARLGEDQFFELRGREAMAYIKAAPVDFFWRSTKRFAAFWFTPWPVAYTILLVLAVWGIAFVHRSFAVFTITLFALYPLVFYATQTAWPTCYRHPIEPMILLLAAQPVCRLPHRERTWQLDAKKTAV
jgi:hypothetical protein